MILFSKYNPEEKITVKKNITINQLSKLVKKHKIRLVCHVFPHVEVHENSRRHFSR